MSTIAGDCLLSAAFITYAGYFEQQMRQNLFTTWSHHLQQANIQVLGAPKGIFCHPFKLWPLSHHQLDVFCQMEQVYMQAHIVFPISTTVASIYTIFFLFQFRTDIARTEYLSNADERLRWQANSLPADDLCTENAIMLKRFNRSVSLPSSIATF